MTIPSPPLRHDGETVRLLQQTHADKIEAEFSGLGKMPGDPYVVRIPTFGETRLFFARGREWETRALLTGNESAEELDAIIAYFAACEARQWFAEINPANFLRTEPFSWDAEMVAHLLGRGLKLKHFRCVWHATPATLAPSPALPAELRVRHFGSEETAAHLEALVEALQVVEGDDREALEERLAWAHQGPRWHHYVAYWEGAPCAGADLFLNPRAVGCLNWSITRREFRGRGCQTALIHARAATAFAAGCHQVFAVTDFDIPSARNLQRAGFRLAYNYLMFSHTE